MSWRELLGIVCIVSFFFPVAVIMYNRFYTHRSLIALVVYCIMTGIYNLMAEKFVPSSASFRSAYAMLDNYLDVPLMLITLLFFCPNRQKQKPVRMLIIAFIAYEIVITLLYGFKPKSVVYILGPGLAVILIYTFYLFVRQVKFSILHRKNQGRTIMLAAILFAYVGYTLIYYFYYIQKTPFTADVILLYYISSSIATTSLGIGMHLMRKRMKELRSVKLTRKELALFFGHA
jgi:hypothetical protein